MEPAALSSYFARKHPRSMNVYVAGETWWNAAETGTVTPSCRRSRPVRRAPTKSSPCRDCWRWSYPPSRGEPHAIRGGENRLGAHGHARPDGELSRLDRLFKEVNLHMGRPKKTPSGAQSVPCGDMAAALIFPLAYAGKWT